MNPLLKKTVHETTPTKAGDRQYDFMITSGRVDRDGDTINPYGWNLEEYKKNPVVLFGHRHDIPAIGRCATIDPRSDGLVARMEFPPAGVYPLSDHVRSLVDAGILIATSVGFRGERATPNKQRGGTDYHEQTLLEWSIVNVPSNIDAVLTPTRDTTLAVLKWLSGGDDNTIMITDLDDDPVSLPDAPGEIERLLSRSRALGQEQRRLLTRRTPPHKSRIGCPAGHGLCDGSRSGRGRCPVSPGNACPFPGRPTVAESRKHEHVVVAEDGQLYTYDARSIDLRAAHQAVRKALVEECLKEYGPALLRDAVREVVLPEVRRAYTRLTGRLD